MALSLAISAASVNRKYEDLRLRSSPASIVSTCAFSLVALLLATVSSAQTPQSKIGSLDLRIGGIQATVRLRNLSSPKTFPPEFRLSLRKMGRRLRPQQSRSTSANRGCWRIPPERKGAKKPPEYSLARCTTRC